jgi:hypothetical protein
MAKFNIRAPTGRRGIPAIIGVGGIFLVVVFFWSSWMTRDQGLPQGDENRYLASAERARRVLETPPDGIGATLEALGDVHPTHPPLFPVAAGLLMGMIGPELQRLMVIQIGFLLLLLISVYNAGRILTDRGRGLAATILVAAFPLVFKYTHEFYLELPTTALTAWAMWLLIAWRAHGGWHRALLLGLAIALGLLTKWTFIVFITVPAISLLDRLRRHRDLGAVEVWVGFFLGLVLALPWYIRHQDRIAQFIAWNQANAYWHLADPTTLGGWLFYPLRLPHLMGGVAFVLTVVGLGFALTRSRREGVVLGWFLFPFIVFALIGTKAYDARHLLPVLPAAALLGSLVVTTGPHLLRGAAWGAVLSTVPLNLIPAAGLGMKHTLRGVIPGTDYSIGGYYQEPETTDFGVHQIYAQVRAEMERTGEARAGVLVLAAVRSLSSDALIYLSWLEGKRLTVFDPEPQAGGEGNPEDPALLDKILRADFVVVKAGLPVDSNVNHHRDDFLRWHAFFVTEGFAEREPLRRIASVVTPDSDEVRIYRRDHAYSVPQQEEIVRRYLTTLIDRSFRADHDHPGYRSAMLRLAGLVREQGDIERAVALEDLVRIVIDGKEDAAANLPARAAAVPHEPWLAFESAWALFDAGKAEPAAALLGKRPAECALEPAMLGLLGTIREHQERFGDAVRIWQALATLDPLDPEPCERLVLVHEAMGSPDATLDRVRRIAELKTRVAAGPFDHWQDSRALAELFEKDDPGEAEIHLYRAVLAAPPGAAASIAAFQDWMALQKRGGNVDAVIAFLRRRYSIEKDEAMKKQIEAMLERL